MVESPVVVGWLSAIVVMVAMVAADAMAITVPCLGLVRECRCGGELVWMARAARVVESRLELEGHAARRRKPCLINAAMADGVMPHFQLTGELCDHVPALAITAAVVSPSLGQVPW